MVDNLAVVNQGEEVEVAEGDEVTLDGLHLPVGSVVTSYTSRFESKLTFGDYSKDSDQLLSTWIQSMWAGGMLIDDHQEGATDQRGRWACAWTMTPEQLALPPKHEVITLGDEISVEDVDAHGPVSLPLIEVQGVLYLAMGKELFTVSADLYGYDNIITNKVADLAGYAQGNAVLGETDGIFYIPLGTAGIATVHSHTNPVTPDTVTATDTTINAFRLLRWDNKMFALEFSGQIRIFQIDGGTWDVALPALRLPPSDKPRGMDVFYDQSGNQAVYVVSDSGLWAVDYDIPKLYSSSLKWPKHHNTGMGLTPWRDDALYIASGFSVTRYTRDGVRTDMGLDRDDGIPADVVKMPWGEPNAAYQPGRAITSMVGTQNFIAAAVQMGAPVGLSGDYPYAICAWNESGWHVLVEDALPSFAEVAAGRYPIGLFVTENVGGYRIWWGEGGSGYGATPYGYGEYGYGPYSGTMESSFIGSPRVHSIGIPRSFHGPRQKVMDNLDAFAPSGYYETGWFDAGMRGFDKTWSHFEVYLTDPGNGIPLSGSVDVEYRLDSDPNTWKILGVVNTYGRTVLPFNMDSSGVPRGETSRSIEMRLNLSTPDDSQSPIVNSFILKFIKLPLPGRSWMLSVDLEGMGWKNMGPREIQAMLARHTYQGRFSVFIDNNRKYRVRVSQVQVTAGPGGSPARRVQVNLIEVPVSGDPTWGGDE